jgi:hypothetical protein
MADYRDIPGNIALGAGQSIRRNAGDTAFEAYTPSGGGTPGGSSGSVQYNSSGAFAGDTSLYYDATNKRLGIGTNAPANRLQVYGTTTSDGVSTNVGYNISTVSPPPDTFTCTPVSGSGMEIGTYYYRVTYYNAFGETGVSGYVQVVTTSGNQRVQLSNIPLSSDPTVIGRKIYRDKVNTSPSYGAVVATIADNTTTTHTDATPDADILPSYFLYRLIYNKANLSSRYITINGLRSFVIDSAGTTIVGYDAGTAIVSGGGHTLVGLQAGKTLRYGSGNTLIGYQAGYGARDGANNTAVGIDAMFLLRDGSSNVGLGDNALYQVTDGSSNIGLGYYAGYSIVSGSNNIYIGSVAGYGSNYTGGYNIGIGYGANPLSASGSYQLNIGNTIFGEGMAAWQTTRRVFIRGGSSQSSNIFEVENSAGSFLAGITAGGALKTSAPSGGTAGEWKLGSRVAATVALDTTQYVQVDIGGTLYKLAIVS